jgi:hypothetical protein
MTEETSQQTLSRYIKSLQRIVGFVKQINVAQGNVQNCSKGKDYMCNLNPMLEPSKEGMSSEQTDSIQEKEMNTHEVENFREMLIFFQEKGAD